MRDLLRTTRAGTHAVRTRHVFGAGPSTICQSETLNRQSGASLCTAASQDLPSVLRAHALTKTMLALLFQI